MRSVWRVFFFCNEAKGKGATTKKGACAGSPRRARALELGPGGGGCGTRGPHHSAAESGSRAATGTLGALGWDQGGGLGVGGRKRGRGPVVGGEAGTCGT